MPYKNGAQSRRKGIFAMLIVTFPLGRHSWDCTTKHPVNLVDPVSIYFRQDLHDLQDVCIKKGGNWIAAFGVLLIGNV